MPRSRPQRRSQRLPPLQTCSPHYTLLFAQIHNHNHNHNHSHTRQAPQAQALHTTQTHNHNHCTTRAPQMANQTPQEERLPRDRHLRLSLPNTLRIEVRFLLIHRRHPSCPPQEQSTLQAVHQDPLQTHQSAPLSIAIAHPIKVHPRCPHQPLQRGLQVPNKVPLCLSPPDPPQPRALFQNRVPLTDCPPSLFPPDPPLP